MALLARDMMERRLPRATEAPVALMDRRYWRDFQRELPPDFVVLEKISIQGQELYIVRSGAGG